MSFSLELCGNYMLTGVYEHENSKSLGQIEQNISMIMSTPWRNIWNAWTTMKMFVLESGFPQIPQTWYCCWQFGVWKHKTTWEVLSYIDTVVHHKKNIYIYICMFLIKDIISIHSFVLTTTNSPPSTHLPTENNLPNLPTDCSKLLIFTNRLLSKTRSTFYDFSLKPSTHWESREPLNWVWKHLRMFWCQPFGSHAEQKGAIQKRKILRQ